MHEHKECEHELKYCSKCDVVYCEKCKNEWHNYTMTISTPFTYVPCTTTYEGDGTKPVDVTPKITCTH